MICYFINLKVAVHKEANKFGVYILSHLRPRLEIIVLNFGSHLKKNIFVCAHVTCVRGPVEARDDVKSPRTRVTASCKLLGISAGTPAKALWKIKKHF